jgi:hypothetical protein
LSIPSDPAASAQSNATGEEEMLTPFVRRLLIAALAPLAASCASEKYPASPVPAAMSDLEAARLADIKLAQRDMAPRVLHSAEQTRDGWLLAYQSPFNTAMTPPTEWRLVEVKNTGEVREITFRKGG